jgi:fatty acid kinase fatty acid binding subunit
MGKRIGIVTDNTADIPEELKQALNIHTIPTNIVLDGKVYRDGIDLTVEEFYRNFHHYKTMASQPVTYEDYALTYKKLTYEYEELVFVHVSSKLSGTYEIALKVHDDFKDSHNCRVVIIDSLQCSMAYGIPVIAAARMAQKGRSIEDIAAQISHILQNMSAFFAVPDLKYLRKGKKISGLRSLVGTAMKVKPVMAIENGENVVKTKLFGEQKNMILTMLDMIREDIAGRPITLAILQTAAEVSIINSLREVFQSEFKCMDIFDAYYSPSIGLNMGPASTGIAYYKHPMRR